MNVKDIDALKAHVTELEQQLQVTKTLLRNAESTNRTTISLPIGSSLHNLLLLSDSALPLGSFAYSSGLESFLAHHKGLTTGLTNTNLFRKFLDLSIQSIANTNIPYVLACFRDPLSLMELDNDFDASTPCTVARRASIAQGRALLSIWEKAKFQSNELEATTAIGIFAEDLKRSTISKDSLPVNGHFAPLWGVICLSLGLNLEEAGYLFLLNHIKAVISSAIRASVMGPYLAQNILASQDIQDMIRRNLEKVWFLQPEQAGQSVPLMDLWIGRHELLYSRIFNS